MSRITFRAASAEDHPAIESLLAANALPTSDLSTARPQFLVAADQEQRLQGAGALQHFGDVALLRSVVIDASLRNAGIGRALVAQLEIAALERGCSQLILLTQTARPFFERLGYAVIDRMRAPAEVQASEEFRSLCPSSAVCMTKMLENSRERSRA